MNIPVEDASFKMPSGLFSGNLWWLGAYDQCRDIRVPVNLTFKARYVFTVVFHGSPGVSMAQMLV